MSPASVGADRLKNFLDVLRHLFSSLKMLLIYLIRKSDICLFFTVE